ncbi:MAG: hypothetical protein KAU28_10775, partial [Phycisphaerae bacterium]|nr:hypothetical protein [Phycisphaerae bacterium]
YLRGRRSHFGRLRRRAARRVLSAAKPQVARRPFGFLEDIASCDIASLLEAEHPQTVAMVLAHIRPGKAAAILAELAPQRQVEVTRRIAGLERIDAEVVRQIEQALSARVSDLATSDTALSGAARVAEILQHAGGEMEKTMLEALSDSEPALAESIYKRLMAFEDIARLPAGRLREALAVLESDELAVALRTAGDGLKRKVLSALPTAAARQVREEMDRIGPVRLSDVEAAQQRVAEIVRQVETGRYVSHAARGSEVLA